MHSIRTKLTAVSISAIIITTIIVTTFAVVGFRSIGVNSAEQMIMLLCEAGQKNLDSYLSDVEQEVNTISAYVEEDLDGMADENLELHLGHASEFFRKVVYRTGGIMTYYFRIDPTVSEKVKGFWFVKNEDGSFSEHEVTDITLYDTEDTSKLVWFTVPKATGKGVWLHPYITDNLDVRVISYNTPVYYEGRFVGVIGIELDYSFLSELVNNITLFENGYAFVNDAQGNLIYHPHMDVLSMENLPPVPQGMVSDSEITHYTYEGVKKILASRTLVNGDRLNVAVPMREINERWQVWINAMIFTFGILTIVLIVFFRRYAKQITKPLMDLTKVAEQIDKGNYNCKLDYKGDDEIGILTRTFSRVTSNLKENITHLNDLAYADALTSLNNKSAFDNCTDNIQSQMEKDKRSVRFAVCIFDCNSLKIINDQNGHDKGDFYLKETAAVIEKVFEHSPIFRIGGDEFAAVLRGSDYDNRDALIKKFDRLCSAKRKDASQAWEQVDVARGMAVYDPDEDDSVNEVIRRADKNMYQNKFSCKKHRQKKAVE